MREHEHDLNFFMGMIRMLQEEKHIVLSCLISIVQNK